MTRAEWYATYSSMRAQISHRRKIGNPYHAYAYWIDTKNRFKQLGYWVWLIYRRDQEYDLRTSHLRKLIAANKQRLIVENYFAQEYDV